MLHHCRGRPPGTGHKRAATAERGWQTLRGWHLVWPAGGRGESCGAPAHLHGTAAGWGPRPVKRTSQRWPTYKCCSKLVSNSTRR
eukprot:scaffold527_cov368-Prasinococcus_capsulatus_cf.AAC.12